MLRRLSELVSALEPLPRSMAAGATELQRLSGLLASRDLEVSAMRSELSEARGRLSSVQAVEESARWARSRVADAEARAEAAQEALRSATADAQAAREELAAELARTARFKAKLSDVAVFEESLRREATDSKSQVAELRAELDATMVAVLRARNEKAQTELRLRGEHASELQTMKDRLAEAQERASDLDARLKRVEAEADSHAAAARSKINEQAAELRALHRQLDEFRTVDVYAATLSQLKAATADAREFQ